MGGCVSVRNESGGVGSAPPSEAPLAPCCWSDSAAAQQGPCTRAGQRQQQPAVVIERGFSRERLGGWWWEWRWWWWWWWCRQQPSRAVGRDNPTQPVSGHADIHQSAATPLLPCGGRCPDSDGPSKVQGGLSQRNPAWHRRVQYRPSNAPCLINRYRDRMRCPLLPRACVFPQRADPRSPLLISRGGRQTPGPARAHDNAGRGCGDQASSDVRNQEQNPGAGS